MRLYETTSTVRQDDACILQQYAFILRNLKMMLAMSVVIAVIGIVFGIASLKQNVAAGALCFGLFAFAAVIMFPIGKLSAKRTAANLYPGGDDEWRMTTWFENDGIHRADDEGEDDVLPLNKLVCAYRAGNVLLLGTHTHSVLPVNLLQLSETDRKSLFENLKTECPKLKMIQKK